jgi:DNA-binding transcriptional regulator YiaG
MALPARDLAEILGVSQRTLYNWENGITTPGSKYLQTIDVVRKLGKR